MNGLTVEQHEILLRPLNASRVVKRKQAGTELSYLEQHDVRAHLIRVFGFCGFDLETVAVECAFDEQRDDKKWEVGYRATMKLTVRDLNGKALAVYSETAVGTSTQGRRGEAHDMAMKTASSDAMKRCCINLGDQYGLSLYNHGSLTPIVRMTIVGTGTPVSPDKAPEAEPETPKATTPPEVMAFVAEASQFADLPAGERITSVAKAKVQHKDMLQHTINVDGSDITVGRWLDLLAAGQYSEEK